MGNAGLPSSDVARTLVVGPAGSGKSRRLRERLVAAIQSGREAQSLLIVPTASYRDHTRNLILRESALRGWSGASVRTFRELLAQLAPAAPTLSPAKRELMVDRLLKELTLPQLSGVRDFPGFRAAIVRAADEVLAAGLNANTLERGLAGCASPDEHRSFLAFFRAYHAALKLAGEDNAKLLDAALEAIDAGCSPVSLLLVDGFSDFTFEQRKLLEALIAKAPEASVSLTLTADATGRGLFYQAERSRAWLRSMGFGEVELEGNQRSRSAALRSAECLLRGEKVPEIAPSSAGELCVISAADRQDECELIARETAKLVREGRYRYRDIGVIIRQTDEYTERLRAAFQALGIPVRSFSRTAAAATPAGRHLRLCLELFLAERRPDAQIEWLKSPYSTFRSRFEIDRFQTLAYRRLASAQSGDWEAVLRGKSPIEGVLAGIATLDKRRKEACSLAELCDWALDAFERLTLRREPSDGIPPERVLELRAEARAFECVESLLAELREAAAAEQVGETSYSDFCSLVTRLLAQETVSIMDRRQGAVNLMNPFEARQWEMRVVFVPGLLEKEFPARPRESLFLKDHERRALSDSCGAWLPTSGDRARDERLLFYISVTRAAERLYLSYPASDADGKQALRSFFLRDLAPLIDSSARRVERRRSEVIHRIEFAACREDLIAMCHAALAIRLPENLSEGDERRTADQRARAIYERYRGLGLTSLAASALTRAPQRLRLESVRQAISHDCCKFSVSDLEDFAACQFKYFAKRLLQLGRPPDPAQLDGLLEGTIAHAAAEQWCKHGGKTAIQAAVDEKLAASAPDVPSTHQTAKCREMLLRFLNQFVLEEQAHAERYGTQLDPKYLEFQFGEDSTTPPLDLKLPDGTLARLNGRVDRIEVTSDGGPPAALVVDLKYSARAFGKEIWQKIEDGESLQLPLYLLAARELLGMQPAGAELYALKAERARRSGVYDQSYAGRVLKQGKQESSAKLLSHAEFELMLERSRQAAAAYAAAIRSGAVAVSQDDEGDCEFCDYQDICRVTPWMIEQNRRQKTGRRAAAGAD